MARGSDIVKIGLCFGFGVYLMLCASAVASALDEPGMLQHAQQGLSMGASYQIPHSIGLIIGANASVIYAMKEYRRMLVIPLIAVTLFGCYKLVLMSPFGHVDFVWYLRPAAVGVCALSAMGMAMQIVPVIRYVTARAQPREA